MIGDRRSRGWRTVPGLRLETRDPRRHGDEKTDAARKLLTAARRTALTHSEKPQKQGVQFALHHVADYTSCDLIGKTSQLLAGTKFAKFATQRIIELKFIYT